MVLVVIVQALYDCLGNLFILIEAGLWSGLCNAQEMSSRLCCNV